MNINNFKINKLKWFEQKPQIAPILDMYNINFSSKFNKFQNFKDFEQNLFFKDIKDVSGFKEKLLITDISKIKIYL